MRLILWCHIVHHILPATPHLWTIILKVPDQVPLLQAPALGQEVPQGVHQVLAAQAHQDQAQAMSPVQVPQRNPKHPQRAVTLVAQSDLILHHLK